jgi:hypothetical protein
MMPVIFMDVNDHAFVETIDYIILNSDDGSVKMNNECNFFVGSK